MVLIFGLPTTAATPSNGYDGFDGSGYRAACRSWGGFHNEAAESMNTRLSVGLLTLVSIAALAAMGGWYHAHQSLQASRSQFAANALQHMAVALKGNQAIIAELQTDPSVENDKGILESYLVKIRRDGVAKNAEMKQRLDTLAENNTTIVALIKAYSPQAKTAAFTTEADDFRNYASAWRDRWNSVMELFMAGGNYPAAGPAFPKDFAAAVQTEIAASR